LAIFFPRYEDQTFITRFIENKEKDYLGLGLTVSTLFIVVLDCCLPILQHKKPEGWCYEISTIGIEC
jgi:FHS family L-fucose permease-like MFS transporter